MARITWKRVLGIVGILLLFIVSLGGIADRLVDTVISPEKTRDHLNGLVAQATVTSGVAFALDLIVDTDAVSTVSTIMFMSLASLAIQRVIFEIGTQLGAGVFVTLAILFFSLMAVCRRLSASRWTWSTRALPLMRASKSLATLMLILFALSRLLVPTIAFVSLGVETVMNSGLDAQVDQLQSAQKTVEQNSHQLDENTGLFTRIGTALNSLKQKIGGMIESLKNSVNIQVQRLLSIAITFFVQTIAIPLLTLLLLKMVWKYIRETIIPATPTTITSDERKNEKKITEKKPGHSLP